MGIRSRRYKWSNVCDATHVHYLLNLSFQEYPSSTNNELLDVCRIQTHLVNVVTNVLFT